MSVDNYVSPGNPYWAPNSLVDEVDQLELSVAFSSLTEPTVNTIATWDDPGTGTYPLTTNRGATKTTGITVIDKDMSTLESLDFDQVAANPGGVNTLWVNSGDGLLYQGASAVGGGSGDVVGPASAVDKQLCQFDGATGKLIKACAMQFIEGSSADNMVMTTGTSSLAVASSNNVICTPGAGVSLAGGATDNTCMGAFCAAAITSGALNSCFGSESGRFLTNGTQNCYMGWSAGKNQTTGDFNVGIGSRCLETSIAASNNTGLGANALQFCTSGNANCAIGKSAMNLLQDGVDNIAIGNSALSSNISGINNVSIGSSSASSATSSNNVSIGKDAHTLLTTGSNNVAIGQGAGGAVTTSSNNIAIGCNGLDVSERCFIGQVYNKSPLSSTWECAVITNGDQLCSRTVLETTNQYSITYVNSAGPYNVAATDEYLMVEYTATGAITINLPDPTSGQRYISITDGGESSSSFNITVASLGTAPQILGRAVINVDGSTAGYISDPGNNRWIQIFYSQ